MSVLEKSIVEVIDRYSGGDRYEKVKFANLTPEEKLILNQENIETLFNLYLEKAEPDYARIRWLFRRLAQVGAPSAIPFILKKVNILLPAIADVCHYIISVQDNFDDNFSQIGEELIGTLKLPIISHSEYLSGTLLSLYSLMPSLNNILEILQMYKTASPMAQRQIVCAATAQNVVHWLRERKDILETSNLWLRRALIAGTSIFNDDEREAWLKPIERTGTDLEKILVKWIKNKSEEIFLSTEDTPISLTSEEMIIEEPNIKLYEIIKNNYSLEELRTLCFELEIDYDDLPAQGKANKARELILLFKRLNRLPELVKIVKKERPNEKLDF